MPFPPTHPHLPTRREALLGLGGALVTTAAIDPVHAHAATAPSIVLGAWTAGMDADPRLLDATAARIGARMGIASIFRGRGDTWPYPGDVRLGAGRTLLVAWSLEDWGDYAWWAAGHGDGVLRAQAARLRAYGRPVAIRPWAEMNGDWAAHQVRPAGRPKAPRGGTPAQFVAAWRRVVTVMRSAGATNVRWVLNPTTDTYAGTTDIRTIHPGNAYVDILGLDGYNWGTGKGLAWRRFDDVYRTQYARLTAMAPGKPVWLCEVSSADPASRAGAVRVAAPAGATKGRWWGDAFAHLRTGYPRVRAVVLFDAAKERDWRVASSSDALLGLRAAVRATPRVVR